MKRAPIPADSLPGTSLAGGSLPLPHETRHYLMNVLRLGPGEHVELFDGTGRVLVVELREGSIALVLSDERSEGRESPLTITLYQAIPKGDRWEWLLEKACEAGVARVVPLQTARSVVKIAPNKADKKLERWRRIPAYMDQVNANLERGLAHGRVASYTTTNKVLGQVEAMLRVPPHESPLATCLPEHASPGLREEVLAVVRDEIYPAFARHRRVLAERVLPNARDDLHPGLGHVPGGPEAYRHCIRRETSLELSPEEIHAIGLAEVARIRDEIVDRQSPKREMRGQSTGQMARATAKLKATLKTLAR